MELKSLPASGAETRSSIETCLVCGESELQRKFFAKKYEIVSCSRCTFCQVAEPPSDAELERMYAELHLKHLTFRDERAARRENEMRFQLVRELVPHGSSLFDAGCATGDFLELAKECYQVSGVDISTGAIEVAKARLPDIAESLFSLKLEEIDPAWPPFDAICLWDVIEHVRDPVGVCRILMNLLKPGGYLFISTPDVSSFSAKIMRQHWAFMIPPLHLGYFSRASFEHLFTHQVPGEIQVCRTKGKWTNLSFLFYKINQMSSVLAPQALLRWISTTRMGRMNLYVPTNDIIYLAVKKPNHRG